MIKQSTVLMATPLAMLASEKGIDLHDKAGDLIKGLNEATAHVVSFTEDNVATELPDYTTHVPTHTEALDVASSIVADTIRGALYTISKTVKPILKEAEERLRQQMEPDTAVEVILRNVDLELINIEPSFLNSGFYPKESAPSFRETGTVRMSELLTGVWPRMSGEELVELIAVPVDELQGFFTNPGEIKDIYDTLFVEKNWYNLFDSRSVDNGVVNIKNIHNYRFSSFRTLVIGTLLTQKLVSMDDPMDGVTGVGLDEYRTGLLQTRDMFSTMLFEFKQVWEQRAQAGIVVISDNVTFAPMKHGLLGGVGLLGGNIIIGYNRAVLEMFADSNELSLSEYVLGSLYAKHRGYNVRDIITDKDTVVNAWREYRTDVQTALVNHKGPLARKAFSSVLEGLYAKEEFTALIDAMPEDNIPGSQRVMQRVANNIDLNLFFSNIPMVDAVLRGDNSLMNTQLAVILAAAFDSPIAVEILQENALAPAGTKEQQRKHLSLAIDKVIIKRLFA